MFGVIRKISPYTNRKSWKMQIEIDDYNVPQCYKNDPWSIAEIPVEIKEVVASGEGKDEA